jgi:hypothetical protein
MERIQENKILYVNIVYEGTMKLIKDILSSNHFKYVIFGNLFTIENYEILQLPHFCDKVFLCVDNNNEIDEVEQKFIDTLKMPFGCKLTTFTKNIIHKKIKNENCLDYNKTNELFKKSVDDNFNINDFVFYNLGNEIMTVKN